MGFSPDAFVQMAFQAAYYGLYGRVECTYEPAMTKMFHHGRTEAIRSVTDESVNFVQTFWADHPAEEKVEALKKACQQHTANTRNCAKAQGCDRHLYALFCLWQRLVDAEMDSRSDSSNGYSSPDGTFSDRGGSVIGSPGKDSLDGFSMEERIVPRARGDSTTSRNRDGAHPLPLIFADPGWDKLNTTIISTSNCGNPSLRQFGFGPVSGDGFGIGYIIKDDGISICVSSKHRQTERFVDTLESYLLEIRRILRITSRKTGVTTKQTRARELDENKSRPKAALGRVKSRGRIINALDIQKSQRSLGSATPTEGSLTMSDDDELGGCKLHFSSGVPSLGACMANEVQMASSTRVCFSRLSRREVRTMIPVRRGLANGPKSRLDGGMWARS
jgi:carnitine O-acetyltransferase